MREAEKGVVRGRGKIPTTPPPKARPRTWPTPQARQTAYGLMTAEHARSMGIGYDPSVIGPPKDGDGVEEYQERRIASYSLFTDTAMDRLVAMAEIVALVEGKSRNEILKKVRGY